MSGTWAKLRSGGWGIRVVGEVKPGGSVTVTRKNGSTSIEIVRRVIWRGDDGIALCSVETAGAVKAKELVAA